MKKLISLMLAMVMGSSLTLTACAAEGETVQNDVEIILQIGNPNMTVNGGEKPIDNSQTSPVIVNDRTLLPVRAVVEEMGGTVSWNGETREVTLNLEDDEIGLTINSNKAYLNGEEQTLDTAPVIINDRTMLPIRFIAESFRFDVEWDQDTRKVIITKAKEEIKPSPDPSAAPQAPVPEDETKKGTLVAYFSATGTTEVLAKKFAEAAKADIFRIVPEEEYTPADLNYNSDCRANREQNDDSSRPAIANTIDDFASYDTVIIGHPIWWGTIPRIIYTFMDTYDLSGKNVYMFCTSGSSGIGTALSDVRRYAPDANVINGMRGTRSTTVSEIEEWLIKNGGKINE